MRARRVQFDRPPGDDHLGAKSAELVLDEGPKVDVGPARRADQAVGAGQRHQPPLEDRLVIGDRLRLGQADQALHHRQHIVRAMVHFPREQGQPFLCLFLLADVDQHRHRSKAGGFRVEDRRRISREIDARPVWALGHGFSAEDRPPLVHRDRGCAHRVREGLPPVRMKLPGDAPFVLAQLGSAAGQGDAGLVEISDLPVRVGRVDRRRQRFQQLAETDFALPKSRHRGVQDFDIFRFGTAFATHPTLLVLATRRPRKRQFVPRSYGSNLGRSAHLWT